MNDAQYTQQNGSGDQCACCCSADAGAELQIRDLAAGNLDSLMQDDRGLAAVRAARVTGTDELVAMQVTANQLGSANSFALVATGSCCSPNAEALASSCDCASESSVDILNLAQGDNCCGQGVHNGDALVVNQELGANENGPDDSCCKGGQGKTEKVEALAVENNLNQVENNENAGDCCQSDRTLGSEHNQISHSTSFAGLTLTAVNKGK